MSEPIEVPPCADGEPCAAPQQCDCPPPAERPAQPAASDPRGELLRMAAELMRSRDARLLAAYLRLRRAVRVA